MKRVILSATRTGIITKITDGFKSAGCNEVIVTKHTDSFCKLHMILPNGKRTTITVWYDYNVVKNGKATKVNRLTWKSSYVVDSEGNVFDGNTLVGKAFVEVQGESYERTRNNYLIRSIRTDSGDVIIDHPEKANNYKTVVDTLQSRKITHRS